MKCIYLIFCFALIAQITQAQIVNIPDANFKNALVGENVVDTNGDGVYDADVDTNNDNEIQVSEAEAVIRLNVNRLFPGTPQSEKFTSLEGIQSFINLQILLADNSLLTSIDVSHAPELRQLTLHLNNLTSIDVSQNLNLEKLDLYQGNMQSLDVRNNTNLTWLRTGAMNLNGLDVSQNINLTFLSCSTNGLNELDLSQNIKLKTLWAHANNLTELDLSQNTQLETLHCEHNKLTNLDLSSNLLLERIYCHKNLLTSLNVSQIPNLKNIECGDNFIKELDFSLNPLLVYMGCSFNQLRKLSLNNGNNTELTYLEARHNPELECIQVDDETFANSQTCGGSTSWCIDSGVVYNEDCLSFIINIPDTNFKNALINTNCVDTTGDGQGNADADTNNDGEIQQGEADAVVSLHISNNNISSLEGIKNFYNLEYLDCSINQISTLSLTGSRLKYLWCGSNQLTNLDVWNAPNLISLGCSSNLLSNLRLDNNALLKYVQCQHNQLTNLDIANGNNAILERMMAYNNPNLTCIRVDTIDIANNQECDQANNTGWCKDVTSEYCSVNIDIPDVRFKSTLINSDVNTNGDEEIQYHEAEAISSLNVDDKNIGSLEGIFAFKNITFLDCSNNSLTSLDLSQNRKLETLWCQQNELTELNISQNINLYQLECWRNQLTELNVSQNLNLWELDLGENYITNLDVSQNVALERLFCNYNNLSSLDMTQNPHLRFLWCYGNQLTILNLSNGIFEGLGSFLARGNSNLACIQVDDEAYANSRPNCDWPGYGWCIDETVSSYSEDCNYPFINIPDANFKNALLNTNCVDLNGDGLFDSDADTNNDGEIQYYEAESVRRLNVSDNSIVSLEGIEYFKNLTILNCANNQISQLDISQNTALEILECDSNDLFTLDVSQNPNLLRLDCYSNDLHNLNIQNGNNTKLNRMFAFDNYNLTCIQVDDEAYANSLSNCESPYGWCISETTSYSEGCEFILNTIDSENISEILIYPNPVDRVLYIESQKQIENITIYSLQGRVIKEVTLVNEIDVSNLATGLYFIQVSIKGNTFTKRFIKK